MDATRQRRQINVRTDAELDEAVAALQRAAPGAKVPSQSDVIRKAVFEAHERLRRQAERRK
jgi:hypothetical protein